MIKKNFIILIFVISILLVENLVSKTYPSKPVNLRAVQEDYKIRLTWEIEKSDETIQYFEVYKGENEKNLSFLGRTYSKDQMYYLDYSIFLDKTYYYMVKAVDKDGKYSEPSNIVSIKIVDDKPPELRIVKPEQNNFYTNDENLYILIGVRDNMSGLKNLLVNGVKINQCGCSSFDANYKLVEGKNEFIITAEDNRGNISSLSLVVFLDKTPPKLTTKIPLDTYDENLKITGKVSDEGIGVKYASLNNIELKFDNNGNFETFLFLKEGINELKFKLIDKLNNEKEEIYKVTYIKRKILKFQIGSKTIQINDFQKEIDVAPQIIEGRTYLSIRYVLEPLGGEITWDQNERKVTISLKEKFIELWIGKNKGRVNGVETPIDPNNPKVVPLIISGRTMLPVRFVAENLGCKVEWDQNSKTITITYPKD
ncbi:MAG: stalk domain-containing protein [Caldisericia bacterium]|nr:stalk domain-containing protein [Caldisericia bacterium]